ncbi:hypothetical protein [Acinetobacter higginsii]|uniref:hypothetical protein n=1 Tax=Acinetobacter higginsii TaxID=70347 RepID=UPI001F61A07A|nr:hypothetical protein [Acinetobacter higginsii]MCI3877746.1 hypothetical protein [Acinetobacter higginsii]
MNELTAKAADAIIAICDDLAVDNIKGEKAAPAWRYQALEKIESWAKSIRDAHRKQDAEDK